MLKEWIQKLMAEPEMSVRLMNGQLQLAGVSNTEHKALTDILRGNEGKNEPMKAVYWL